MSDESQTFTAPLDINVGTTTWSANVSGLGTSSITVPYTNQVNLSGGTIDFEADAMKGVHFADYQLPQLWVDILPSVHKIKEMCELYPSFEKVFEKFKTLYEICVDDYESRNKNNQ